MNLDLQAPALGRRLICMVYEAMLLFGIVFVFGFLFDVSTQSKSALMHVHGRQAWLFFVIGAYFVFCWSRSGQTLAMQTWRIRVTDQDGSRLPLIKAVVRYFLAWMWFLPATALGYQFELKEWSMIIVVCLGIIGWALTSRLDKNGQFLHDKLAKTILIQVPEKTQQALET